MWLRHDLETFKKRLKALQAKVAQEEIILTGSQLAALEKAKQEKKAHGETEHPGSLGPRTLTGRHHQGSGQDPPADLLRHLPPDGHRQALQRQDRHHRGGPAHYKRVAPSFDGQGIKLHRIVTDRGTEYCGKPEHDAYQLYLTVVDIDHSRTKAGQPAPDQWDLRAVPQHPAGRMLQPVFQKETAPEPGGFPDRLGRLAGELQPGAAHPGRYCYGETPGRPFSPPSPRRWRKT